jgi:hypothetical protein
MYVSGKYLPLVLAKCLTPKEALLIINAEAVTQNEQDLLKPLIDWLQVAITFTAIKDTAFSLVAQTLPPTIPLDDAKFASKQKFMTEREIPTRLESCQRHRTTGRRRPTPLPWWPWESGLDSHSPIPATAAPTSAETGNSHYGKAHQEA